MKKWYDDECMRLSPDDWAQVESLLDVHNAILDVFYFSGDSYYCKSAMMKYYYKTLADGDVPEDVKMGLVAAVTNGTKGWNI